MIAKTPTRYRLCWLLAGFVLLGLAAESFTLMLLFAFSFIGLSFFYLSLAFGFLAIVSFNMIWSRYLWQAIAASIAISGAIVLSLTITATIAG